MATVPDLVVTVREVRPADSLALLYSIDDKPGFGVTLCAEETLHAAVYVAMFGESLPDKSVPATQAGEQVGESAAIADTLRTKGEYRFEDGWLQLATGVAGVVAVMTEKVRQAQAEAEYEEGERVKTLKRAERAEALYGDLRKALWDALGDRAGDLAAKAARS